MEDRYGTFERELGPSRPEPPPLKPLRQIRRPEMYPSRRMQENTASLLQHQPQPVPRTQPREPSFPRSTPLRKSTSIQNLTQADAPWESITLNRCLFVAITILLITSGFQKLHETLRGHRMTHEEEFGLTRRLSAVKYRLKPSEPQTSLWEVVFWWVPDLTDDENCSKTNRGRSKRSAADRISRGLRNRPLLEKLMKPRENKLKDRRRKQMKDDSEEVNSKKKLKEKKSYLEETEDNVNEEEKEEETSIKSKSQMKKKEKTEVHKV